METYQPKGPRFFCYPASNEVEGPFDLVELAGLFRSNHITAETPVVAEGEENWLPFQDRPEFHLAQEIPQSEIVRHVSEKAEAEVSPFNPRKLLVFAWIMAPVFLFVLYRFVRLYISYHLSHESDSTSPP